LYKYQLDIENKKIKKELEKGERESVKGEGGRGAGKTEGDDGVWPDSIKNP
jgi:hypothetical protein